MTYQSTEEGESKLHIAKDSFPMRLEHMVKGSWLQGERAWQEVGYAGVWVEGEGGEVLGLWGEREWFLSWLLVSYHFPAAQVTGLSSAMM